MELSYTVRIACYALVALGLSRAGVAATTALSLPFLRSRISMQATRWQESYYLLVALMPDAAAVLIALFVAVPFYRHQEVNGSAEHVGLVSLAIACTTLLWYALAAWRGIQLSRRMRLNSGLLRDARTNSTPAPIATHSCNALAVTGLLRTRVVASPQVLRGDIFRSEVLEVAIAHEESHRRHYDNLKLFLISSLHRSGYTSAPVQRWRRAAERAADDDAARGGRARAILLAEALVIAARLASASPTQFAMELMPYESELESRVDRLLNHASSPQKQRQTLLTLGLACICLLQCAPCILMLISHEFAEFIFRLG
jgi:hypothetical protein